MICFTFSSTAMRASPQYFLELENLFLQTCQGKSNPVPPSYDTRIRQWNTTIAQ